MDRYAGTGMRTQQTRNVENDLTKPIWIENIQLKNCYPN
jgi:hypothetical protein